MDRGEKLELLVDKSEKLNESANTFRRGVSHRTTQQVNDITCIPGSQCGAQDVVEERQTDADDCWVNCGKQRTSLTFQDLTRDDLFVSMTQLVIFVIVWIACGAS